MNYTAPWLTPKGLYLQDRRWRRWNNFYQEIARNAARREQEIARVEALIADLINRAESRK